MPDGVLAPSGSEYELEEDDGGDEGDKGPDIVQEGLNSKMRTKGLPKPTHEAITQACCALNPATPTADGKRACEALSDEQAVSG